MEPTLLSTLKAGARVLAANVARPGGPFKITFAITYRCQCRCVSCHIWKREPRGELSTSEIIAFVRATRGVSWLDLTGGEIFLRPDVAEILLGVAEGWPDLAVLHFATNGLLTERIVAATDTLSRATRARIVVTVSVDGDEETNDRLRGVPGAYRRQVSTFNALRRLSRVRAVLGMTLSAANVRGVESALAAWLRDCPGLRPDDVHVNIAQVSPHFYGNEGVEGIPPPPDEALAALAAVRARRRPLLSPSCWLESAYLRGMHDFVASGVSSQPCHALRSSCFVDPFGIVYPCVSWANPVGSLRDCGMDLRAVWAGVEARRVQQAIWGGSCPRCWTACEAYPTILGNLLAPFRMRPRGPHPPAGAAPSEGGA